MVYEKITSKFNRKYGRGLTELSKELKVSQPTLCTWEQQGFDIFHKAKELNALKENRTLQQLWHNLKSRCGNPNDKKYKYYGGKGISIKLNKNELGVLWNRDKADLMKQPSLDRKDSAKDYEFSNCRFIEMEDNRKGSSIKDMDTIKIITDLKKAGVTIEELAFRCKVSTRTIERWEKGKFKPTKANKIYLDQWHKKRVEETG